MGIDPVFVELPADVLYFFLIKYETNNRQQYHTQLAKKDES